MNASSMYPAVMGDAFGRLDARVQQFHTFVGRHEFFGEVQVGAPGSGLAKVLAVFLGAPLESAQGPIRFELLAQPGIETWTRFFPAKTMRSTLTKEGGRITERLGASRLTFELLEIDGALEMRLDKLRFLGVPCPGWLLPQVIARETGAGHNLHFQIQASVPFLGMVASYTGYLEMPREGGE